MKKRRIKGYYTIVDTFNATEMYGRESFEDYCSACETDYKAESDDDWYRWAEDESRMDLDYFRENIRYSKECRSSVIVEGSLGLWWGRPQIEQRFFFNIEDAIDACIDGAYDVIIKKAGNRLEVTNRHHDGSDEYTITFLSSLGESRYERNGKVSTTNRENIVKLPEYLY